MITFIYIIIGISIVWGLPLLVWYLGWFNDCKKFDVWTCLHRQIKEEGAYSNEGKALRELFNTYRKNKHHDINFYE